MSKLKFITKICFIFFIVGTLSVAAQNRKANSNKRTVATTTEKKTAQASNSILVTAKGAGVFAPSKRFSEMPASVAGVYDKKYVEDDEMNGIKIYCFSLKGNTVAFSEDWDNSGTLGNAAFVTSKFITPQGVYPGMLLSKLFKMKGVTFQNYDDGMFFYLAGYAIGFDYEDLTNTGSKKAEKAYLNGTKLRLIATDFKPSAKVKSIRYTK